MSDLQNGPMFRPEDADRAEGFIRTALEQMAEVLALRRLSEEDRERLRALENEAQEQGAVGGMMPFINEGVHEALASDLLYAATTGPMYREVPTPWTVMMDDEDKVIGEWLPEARIAEAKASGRCIFLSEDFVLYKDRRPVGPGRFVMPYICLPLPPDSPLTVCGVGSPSPPGDEYIRSLMGNPGPEAATLVVGACLKAR